MIGPFDCLTTAGQGDSRRFRESGMTAKVPVSVGLADLPQPASRAPAEAANIVRPKLRLVNRAGVWFSVLEIPELQELHPFDTQLLQSFSFVSDDSK